MRRLLLIPLMGLCLFVSACSTTVYSKEGVQSQKPIPELVTKKAEKYGVPPRFAHAVIKVESGYNPKVSSRGAIGLGQIKCPTARGVGFASNCRELFDPDTNLEYSMRYLKLALDRSGGNACYAATLYNQGVGSTPARSYYCRKVLAQM